MDPQNNPQENSQQQGSGLGSGTINNINSGINRYKNFSQNTKNRFTRARNFARKLRGKPPLPIPGVPTSIEGAAKQVVKRALISSPVFWVFVFIVILILATFVGSMSTSSSIPTPSNAAGPSPVPGTDPGGIPTSPI